MTVHHEQWINDNHSDRVHKPHRSDATTHTKTDALYAASISLTRSPISARTSAVPLPLPPLPHLHLRPDRQPHPPPAPSSRIRKLSVSFTRCHDASTAPSPGIVFQVGMQDMRSFQFFCGHGPFPLCTVFNASRHETCAVFNADSWDSGVSRDRTNRL